MARLVGSQRALRLPFETSTPKSRRTESLTDPNPRARCRLAGAVVIELRTQNPLSQEAL
jgi:hypothetical protein